MKKSTYWSFGYIISIIPLLIILLFKPDNPLKAILVLIFSATFAVTHVKVVHHKMLEKDKDYQRNIYDERNIMINEKTGNTVNMVNTGILGIITIVFIFLDYIVPAIILGVLVFIQPLILIFISTMYEKKY